MAWNPSDKTSAVTLSNGNLTAQLASASTSNAVRTSQNYTSGQYYAEFTFTSISSNNYLGIANGSGTVGISSLALGGTNASFGWRNDGPIFHNGFTGTSIEAYTTSDIAELAIDLTAKKIWCRTKANGKWNNDVIANQNPAVGSQVGGFDISSIVNAGAVYLAWGCNTGSTGNNITLNTPNTDTIPTGYSFWLPLSTFDAAKMFLAL